jgi:hypothetical protein
MFRYLLQHVNVTCAFFCGIVIKPCLLFLVSFNYSFGKRILSGLDMYMNLPSTRSVAHTVSYCALSIVTLICNLHQLIFEKISYSLFPCAILISFTIMGYNRKYKTPSTTQTCNKSTSSCCTDQW